MTQAEATFSISTYFHIINPYNSKFIDFSTAPNNEEAIKILTFSDMHHGVIDYTFLDWALNIDISYESLEWFVTKICNSNDRQIISTLRTLFLKYKLFLMKQVIALNIDLKMLKDKQIALGIMILL